MSLTYTTWINSLGNLLPVATTDVGFLTVVPNIIDDAELRVYRELDLLNTVTRDISSALSTGTRTFNLPSANGTFVVVENINVITPAGTVDPELGTRNSLVPATRSVLDFLYPSTTGSTVPSYFAMVTQGQVVVAPWPNQAYQVEVVGTVRPTPLSTTNVTTLLTVFFPDVFIAASMVFAAGYMKNFGAQTDDPRMAVTWEAHLQELLRSAHVEEQRKKFQSQGWSSKEPNQIATPPRT